MNIFDYLSMSIEIDKEFFFNGVLERPIGTTLFTIKLKKDSKQVCYECLVIDDEKMDLRIVYDNKSKHFKKVGQFSKDSLNLKFKSLIKHEYKIKSEFPLYDLNERKGILTNIINHLVKNDFSFFLELKEINAIIDYLYELKLSSFLYIKSKETVDYPSEILFLILTETKQYIMFEKYNDIVEHNLFDKQLQISKFQEVIKNSRYNKNIIKKIFVSNDKKDVLDMIMNDFILESEDYFGDLFSLKRKVSYFYETNLRGML